MMAAATLGSDEACTPFRTSERISVSGTLSVADHRGVDDNFGIGFAKNMCIGNGLHVGRAAPAAHGNLPGGNSHRISGIRAGNEHPDDFRELPADQDDNDQAHPGGQQIIRCRQRTGAVAADNVGPFRRACHMNSRGFRWLRSLQTQRNDDTGLWGKQTIIQRRKTRYLTMIYLIFLGSRRNSTKTTLRKFCETVLPDDAGPGLYNNLQCIEFRPFAYQILRL